MGLTAFWQNDPPPPKKRWNSTYADWTGEKLGASAAKWHKFAGAVKYQVNFNVAENLHYAN